MKEMGKYQIIVVERQYASGGRGVGEMLSRQLGIPYHNQEILQQAADQLSISVEYAQEIEESAASSLLLGLSMAASVSGELEELPLSERLFYEESKLILEYSKQGPCIFIGRCAGQILWDRPDCLRVFLYAREGARVKRAVEQYQVPKANALSLLGKNDRRRSNFYRVHSGKKWDDRESYDLLLNTETLGVEGCAKLIAQAYQG